MPGRLKKKPEYNSELQFNNFFQELSDAYEKADSLRSLADELNISPLKLRKLLITADVFTSDMPSFVIALVMALIIYPVQNLGFSNIITIIIQVLLGASIYITLLSFFVSYQC